LVHEKIGDRLYYTCSQCERVESSNPHPPIEFEGHVFCTPACFKAYVLKHGQDAEVSDMVRTTGQMCRQGECG